MHNSDFLFIRSLLKNENRGFTLIELLVVAIIVGILAATILPNLLGQIGKARETEAKTTLGVLSRFQKAYHLESRKFYDGNDMSVIGLRRGKHYNYVMDTTANQVKAIHSAYAVDPLNSGARDYSVGIYYIAPDYSHIICVAQSIDNDGTTSSVTALTDGTCNSGKIIK